MRPPRCTIDSSCVIALDHLDLLPRLSFLFSLVLVPKAVRKDVFKRRGTKKRVQSLFDQYAFFAPCDDYDKGTVDFLLAERARGAARDRGEAETIVQASQLGATAIVDDSWGRGLAERYDLDFHGTVWVLHRLYELGLMSSPALREGFVKLRKRGIRLPWETVDALLRDIGEESLPR